MSEWGGTGELRSFWEDKVHVVLKTYGENRVLNRVQTENDPNGGTKNLHCNMFQPCNDLSNNFNRNLRKKTEGNQVLTI